VLPKFDSIDWKSPQRLTAEARDWELVLVVVEELVSVLGRVLVPAWVLAWVLAVVVEVPVPAELGST
jgi:hypothetical protein